jgi:hypothetical protein
MAPIDTTKVSLLDNARNKKQAVASPEQAKRVSKPRLCDDINIKIMEANHPIDVVTCSR